VAGICYEALAAGQLTCSQTQLLRESTTLKIVKLKVGQAELWCDVSRGVARPLVPALHRRAVFDAVHSLAHPGIRASRRLVAQRFVWKGCNKNVAEWCRDCQHCQRGKITKQATAAVQPIPIPGRRFSHVHVDLVGPLPVSKEGYKYLFTMILPLYPLAGGAAGQGPRGGHGGGCVGIWLDFQIWSASGHYFRQGYTVLFTSVESHV
jgi:cleavage and polyadenylation specificity factor subunit 1